MKGWSVVRHGAPADVLEFGDLAVPEPEPGTVALRVGATALNLPDERLCRGTYSDAAGAAVHARASRRPGSSRRSATGSIPGCSGGTSSGVAGPPRGALAEVAQIRATGLYAMPEGWYA